MADIFQERAKQTAREIPYEDIFAKRAKPPRSWNEALRGEGKTAVDNLIQGTVGLAKDLGKASPLNPNPTTQAESQRNLLQAGKELVMRPVRELGGLPQPGEDPKSFTPLGYGERIPAALATTFLGASPERVRELTAQGDTEGAMAARIAPAVLTGAIVGNARKYGGSRIPERTIPKRLDLMGEALGNSEAMKGLIRKPEVRSPKPTMGNWLRDIKSSFKPTGNTTELPLEHLFRRYSEMNTPSGRFVPQSLDDLSWANHEFLRNSDTKYNTAVYANRQAQVDVGAQLAANLRKKKYQVVDPVSANPEVLAMNQALENAALEAERKGVMTLGDIDSARQLFFEQPKNPIADALKQRSNADLAIDRLKDAAYKDTVYDALGGLTGQGDFWRNLKRDQSLAIRMKEILRQRLPEVEYNRMIHKPINLSRAATVYASMTPSPNPVHGFLRPGQLASEFMASDRMTPKKAGKLVTKAMTPESRFPLMPNLASVSATTNYPTMSQVFPTLPGPIDPQAATLPNRNNNPLNIKSPRTGEFRQFTDPAQGWESGIQDLEGKLTGTSHVLDPSATLAELIEVWAPKSDNNDPKSYADFVASQLGVSPQTPVAELQPRLRDLAISMAKREGWNGPPPQ
jgi:hypothetical protein